MILKPRAAAGAAGTYRADATRELDHAVARERRRPGRAAAIEEFVEGHEGFYDTLTINGRVAHDFVSHYYPNVLEAMRTRWISPQIVATNRMDAPAYDEVKAMGRRVIDALGIGTSATHMEWFFGPKGLRFSEIGCRPPGVGAVGRLLRRATSSTSTANGRWRSCHGSTDRRPSRRYACGMIALRPDRDGRIAGYEGREEIWRRYGDCIVAHHFPAARHAHPAGRGRLHGQRLDALRHPDYDELRQILNTVGETIRVRAD